ncbi:hypothetical protein TWF730_001854 [Orbilia blumenaviensis]|uniref:Apple domain-containing protein n=1 Tax=Orbilia blumenaviensis TaxID=1796055 RepID=A0AAV9UCP0_9PEZI
MHFSTLTGACLLALSALVGNASAYAYGSSVGIDTTSKAPAPVPTPNPNRYSTSVYTTRNGPVRTIQTCTTEFCVAKPAQVASSTAIVYKPSTTTVTKTESGVQYVTKKDQTRTLTKTTTKSCTSTAKASVHTVYSTRFVKVTSVRTSATVKTVTANAPGYAAGGSKAVVPTPSGFIYAAEDPANDESNFPAVYERSIQRRYEAGGPTYPKSIKCTRTIQTISTRTHTINSKVTSIVYGKTATVTQTKSVTKTVYPNARTATITRVSTSTVVSTSTKTSYTTVTKPATATAPAKTYAACNSANIFNGPTGSVGARLNGDSIEERNVATPEECCARCQAHVNSSGASDCAGSFFAIADGQSTCMLRITNSCVNSRNIGTFVPYADDEEIAGYVSNGPCGRWHVETQTPSNGGTTPSY